MKSKAVKTYLEEKSNLDRSLMFLYTKTLEIEDEEKEQRRKTMLKNKNKTNEGDNPLAIDLIESTKKQLKEIHLFYGVLRETDHIRNLKNNEIHRLVESVKRTLKDRHNYSDEKIDEIKWDIDPSEHESYKKWCARTGNDFHKYETLVKYLNL